jgi:hypothetical protein
MRIGAGALLGAAGLAAADAAEACAVCFRDPQKGFSDGVYAGIWVLVGTVGFVLGVIAFTGWSWARRARALAGAKET